MSVEANNGIRSNLRFAKSLGPKTHQEVINKLAETAAAKRQNILMFHEPNDLKFTERALSTEDQNFVNLMLVKVELAMDRIGLADISQRMPLTEQIVFRECPEGKGGTTDQFGQYIWIHLQPGKPITNWEVVNIFYHEVGHFITDQVVGSANGYQEHYGSIKLRSFSDGFDLTKKAGFKRRGVFGEGLATLFGRDCKNDPKVTRTPYTEHLPFLIAFLESLAQKDSIEPVAAYRELFRANATRDFAFQKKVVDYFGIQTAKGINRIAMVDDHLDRRVLENVAQSGGFQERYTFLQKKIDNGGIIILPGLNGGFES